MTKMRELAQKATPGPWTLYHWGSCVQVDFAGNHGMRPCIVAWPGFDGNDLPLKQNVANAAFIAACSPERILAYEDCVEALKAACCICIDGSAAFITTNGVPMKMPVKAEKIVRAALAAVDALEEQ